MPSEKLTRILRAKSAMSPDEIASLTEREGWEWVYRNAPQPRPKLDEICFTGFSAPDADDLKRHASECGWLKVASTVTTTLSFLCIGENAGPAKMEKAQRVGSTILSREEFFRLISDGEIPA